MRLDLLDCIHVDQRADHGARLEPVGDLHRAGGLSEPFRERVVDPVLVEDKVRSLAARLLRLGELAVRSSPRAWRRTDRFLERAGKRGFGFVSNYLGHLGEGRAGVPQLLHRNLHAPARKVVHWRHSDHPDKAIG